MRGEKTAKAPKHPSSLKVFSSLVEIVHPKAPRK